MRNPYHENGFDTWFYKRGESTIGPMSRMELQKLLDSGQLSPCQAVWTFGKQGLVFVRAKAAVCQSSRQVAGAEEWLGI